MSINNENTSMLIINKKKDINNKLKFYVHKFFSLKNYDFIFFYGNILNIFNQNQKLNIVSLENLEPSSWLTGDVNNLGKNRFELTSGPYFKINTLKNDYFKLNMYGFDDLDIIKK